MMENTNLSKIKRDKMIEVLHKIKDKTKDDDIVLQLNLIENELNEKKYGLIWEEHLERVDVELEKSIPVFKDVREKEIKTIEENDYNFLLEGDNLHSLYLLEKTHKNKIDVIYIDPPYNTRNKDFMYNDEYIDPENEYKHSKWLSFMQRRLSIAKHLLKHDGYIFISINYKEQAQLKLLCDDIFGESNLVGEITWESTTQPINSGSSKFGLQQKCEWILVYCMNSNKKSVFKIKELAANKKYPHKDEYGVCRYEVIEKSDAGAYKRDTMKFEILGQKPRPGKRWQIGKETATFLEENHRLKIVNGTVKKVVYPEDEEQKVSYVPFWSHFDAKTVGTAQNGKEELNKVLNRAAGFDTVKPVALIKEILCHFNKSITVLDFFAGSGTTAQAVLEMNKVDNGNRKFILCTNNENDICRKITYERIKTIITGVRSDGSKYSDGIQSNLKYYCTDYVLKEDVENLYENLMKNIKNLIQLEHGISIDNKRVNVFFKEKDFDDFCEDSEKLELCDYAYVSSDILLTNSEKRAINDYNIRLYIIPDKYFNSEIKEVM